MRSFILTWILLADHLSPHTPTVLELDDEEVALVPHLEKESIETFASLAEESSNNNDSFN